MKKLNAIIYNKLLLQAEEAKEQGLQKLASGVLGTLTASPEGELVTYSSDELNNDIYRGLWALSSSVLKYHNLETADIEKINEVIEVMAEKFVLDLEHALGIPEGTVGPLEPKLFGQD